MSVSTVLLDIEGTTTPISFVKDVLFPYARTSLLSHLQEGWDNEEVQDDIDLVRYWCRLISSLTTRKQSNEDLATGATKTQVVPSEDKNKIIEAVSAWAFEQMDKDRKITALKALQGHIWQKGYQTGELKGV